MKRPGTPEERDKLSSTPDVSSIGPSSELPLELPPQATRNSDVRRMASTVYDLIVICMMFYPTMLFLALTAIYNSGTFRRLIKFPRSALIDDNNLVDLDQVGKRRLQSRLSRLPTRLLQLRTQV